MSEKERWEARVRLRDSTFIWLFGLPLPLVLLVVLWMQPGVQ